jgi:phage terminase Nu1 subunit (DNA packaging protein)
MAPKIPTLSLQEMADEMGVTTRTIQNYVRDGMPHRGKSGAPRFVNRECQKWLRETEVESAVARERDRAGLDKEKELAGKYRVERLLKEHEYDVERARFTPKDETQAVIDEIVGGFAAVAAGRLRRFERDIVQAVTPADARRLTQAIHAALMDGGREFRRQIEAEAARMEAVTAQEEEAA